MTVLGQVISLSPIWLRWLFEWIFMCLTRVFEIFKLRRRLDRFPNRIPDCRVVKPVEVETIMYVNCVVVRPWKYLLSSNLHILSDRPSLTLLCSEQLKVYECHRYYSFL